MTVILDGNSVLDSWQIHRSSRLHRVRTGSVAHPVSYRGAVPLGLHRLRPNTDHRSPPSFQLKNGWSYTPISPYVFMAWCLIKHTYNLTFNRYVTGVWLPGQNKTKVLRGVFICSPLNSICEEILDHRISMSHLKICQPIDKFH